jgi:hypothetical protein
MADLRSSPSRIDKPSAVKLATRHHWRRRKGNTGQMQVCVPLHWFERSQERQDRYADKSTDIDTDKDLLARGMAALEDAVAALREQLTAANGRAEAAEAARNGAEADRRAAIALAEQTVAALADAVARADRAGGGPGARRRAGPGWHREARAGALGPAPGGVAGGVA